MGFQVDRIEVQVDTIGFQVDRMTFQVAQISFTVVLVLRKYLKIASFTPNNKNVSEQIKDLAFTLENIYHVYKV